MKIPVNQQFVKYSVQPVWHQEPAHVQSHLNSDAFFAAALFCHAWEQWVAAWLISDCICVNNHSNIVPNEVATERKSMLYMISAQLWNKIEKILPEEDMGIVFILLMGY